MIGNYLSSTEMFSEKYKKKQLFLFSMKTSLTQCVTNCFVGDAPLTLTVKSVGSKLHNQDGDLNTLNTIRSL